MRKRFLQERQDDSWDRALLILLCAGAAHRGRLLLRHSHAARDANLFSTVNRC